MTSMQEASVSGRMARSAAWLVGFRLIERLLGVVSMLVLARLLVPADFGLVAMAMAVFAALEVLGQFNFDLALVQREQPERKHFDTAWTYTVIVAAASAVILCLLAVPATKFYDEPRVEYILYALAVSALLQGFENIGLVYFQKDLTLDKEVQFRLAKKLIGFVVTIPLAFILRDYWALVVGMVVSRVAGVWISYLIHPYRPRFSLAGSHDLFHFSKWMLFNNLLLFAVVKGVDLTIGKLAGAASLGLYSVAYEISNLPTTELVQPIGRAVFPGYALIAKDKDRLREAYLKVLAVIAIFAIPAGIGIAVLAEPIVRVLLGEKWLAAVDLIQWLAAFGVVRACTSNIGSVYLAVGRPQLATYVGVVSVAILIPLLVTLTPRNGTVAAAWALLAASTLTIPLNLWMLSRLVKLQVASAVAVLWRPVVAATVMGVVISLLHQVMPLSSQIADLVLYIALGVCVYISACSTLWLFVGCPEGAESYLLPLLVQRFHWIRIKLLRAS